MPKNKDKVDILEQKKLELEAELEQIQHELDDSIHKVRSDVSAKLDPIRFIKKYPWPIVGASALLGFLVAGTGNGKKESSAEVEKSHQHSSSDHSGKIFRPVLMNELKRLAARRAVSMATDFLDDVLRSRRYERSTSLRNGRQSVKKD